jgi:secreted trypsin-like serine protease
VRRVLPALLGLLVFAAPAQAVVGGQPVADGQFRYVANVRIMGAFGCTGTLIAPQWVLTAGHCGSSTGSLTQGLVPTPAAWPASAYDIVLATAQADGSGGEDHHVTQVLVDSDYIATNGTGNDVTLMKLDAPAQVAPMKIAAVGERPDWEPGALMTIAGFGTTSENSTQPPPRMQFAQVPITTDAYCSGAYPDGLSEVTDDGAFDANTMVCAGYPQGGIDTCEGDSGGPLLAPLPRGGFHLVGATSFGSGCAEPGKPGVYARLAEGPIREWIKTVVPEAFAPEPAAGSVKAVKAKPHNRKAKRRSSCRRRPRGSRANASRKPSGSCTVRRHHRRRSRRR